MSEAKTYKEMLDEVESIVREVASPEMDLDDMVGKVERGYALIKTMRERLDATREKIDKLQQQYSSPTETQG